MKKTDTLFLSPLRIATVITKEGITDLPIEKISEESVGWKAYGLSSLPSGWVPPFFVITASCFERSFSEETFNAWILEAFVHVGIDADQLVMVRSSGKSETMQNRGQLISTSSPRDQIVSKIRDLITQTLKISSDEVHWIVQEYINPKQQGHLSNERRISWKNRDWVAEFEPQEGRLGYAVPIAVRWWRDGTGLTDLDLRCTSELEITLRLKSVAMWATPFSTRTHFEWVWDGKAVRIVQAQSANPTIGVNPRSLLPKQIHSVKISSLQAFHPANKDDYERYGKLRNANLYRKLGYNMPIFYVIDNQEIVGNILAGEIPPKLESDLTELTRRPLIIRTDGTSIPDGKREMLPRSEELRSYDEAKDWLLTDFKLKIEKSGLANGHLCLIAHHFIPSVASAWARAEPGNRIVRIESLWGIPEGLYWYSHDTFEVDTQTVDVGLGRPTASLKYKSWKRLRYKGTFIAPNEVGNWIPYQTVPHYDWAKSVSKQVWLFEIAHITRQVSEYEKYAVSVMWFIDNHTQATPHKVLPWFHSRSELTSPLKAAPRSKRTSANDFIIMSNDDWQRLQQYLQAGKHIERVVVEPTDTALIRSLQFAEELAALAASNKFVVELSGGILSHVYYILQRHGAQVECIDLFGANEDVVEYNKVVRDKVPSLIKRRGEHVEIKQLKGDALVAALRKKLVEEAFEALDSKSGAELISELADVEEVICGLCRALGVSVNDIEAERHEKEKNRGGFEKGLMLIKTSTPHSIHQSTIHEASELDLKAQQSSEPIISQVLDLPAKSLYRRPDLRQVNQLIEKLFTFQTEINKNEEVKATLTFSMPINGQQQEFRLTIELRRIHSSIRGIVRLRTLPSQLEIVFPE